MEIIVLDIETTGFYPKKGDVIVEVGMALVDTYAKTIKKLFDAVVLDDKFDTANTHAYSWIFKNSTLRVSDVMNANSLESYRDEIQGYLDKYPITAFNMKFDTSFMAENGFTFKKTKCLMEASHPYNVNLDKRGRTKMPNVEEIYNQFYPNENYIETHRAYDDAYHEGKILLKLVELKQKQKRINESTTNTTKNS